MVIRGFGLVLIIFMLASLFIGGAQPQAVGLFPPPWDKLAHATFFFSFAFVLKRFVGLHTAIVIILALLVGAADEFHQLYLPGRFSGLDDWLADAAGASLALFVLSFVKNRYKNTK